MQQLPNDQWHEVIVATALLLGAVIRKKEGISLSRHHEWLAEDDPFHVYGHKKWAVAQAWLWRRHMAVRKDGSVYKQAPMTIEDHPLPTEVTDVSI